MPDISQITAVNGTVYDLKDAQARQDIADIKDAISGGVVFIGETSTELTDGATTNPITINGSSVTAIQGNLVVYDNKEFVFDGTHWIEMGDLSALGDLAWKDSASASYTPAGSVAAPVISVKTAGSTVTVNSITAVGSLPSLTMSVSNENLTFSFDQGTLPTKGSDQTVKTGDAAYEATAPAFTGTQATVTVT